MAAFHARWGSPLRPVVVTGAIDDWPALRRWTPSYLREVHGDRPIDVRLSRLDAPQRHDGDPRRTFRRTRMSLGECIDRLLDPEVAGERAYLQYCCLPAELPRLAADVRVPAYCTSPLLSEGAVWLSGAGTINPLHYDFTSALMAGVVGEKRYVLFPFRDGRWLGTRASRLLWRTASLDPSTATAGALAHTTPYEHVLRPGELLFIPYRWWHYMETSVFSASVSWWWEPGPITRLVDGLRMRATAPLKAVLRRADEAAIPRKIPRRV